MYHLHFYDLHQDEVGLQLAYSEGSKEEAKTVVNEELKRHIENLT